MKNSRQHAQRLQKLYGSLKRVHPKIEPVVYDDPVDALIYGIVSENMSGSAAETAMKGIRRTFVNWNDLRVSRVEEIVEVLGNGTPAGRSTATMLTAALRAVFDCYHTISLVTLKKAGKRPAKQLLENLGGISRFAMNYCMLTSLESHAIPLTERMLEYLRECEIVDSRSDGEDIEGFLTRQVAAKNAYEFYVLLRRECECRKSARKKKTQKKTKTAKTRKK